MRTFKDVQLARRPYNGAARLLARDAARAVRDPLLSPPLPARLGPKAPCLLAVVVAAAALTACGELGATYTGEVQSTPPRLTQAALDRFAPGTPAQTVLRWCRALQQRDGAAAKRFYGAGARTPAVDRDIVQGIFSFAFQSCPDVIETQVAGPRAVVFGEVSTGRHAPNRRRFSSVRPQAFNLRRSGGRWAIMPGTFASLATFPAAERGDPVRLSLVRLADVARLSARKPAARRVGSAAPVAVRRSRCGDRLLRPRVEARRRRSWPRGSVPSAPSRAGGMTPG